MSANSEQHQTFHDGIEEFGKYAYNTTKDEYDPKRLVAILDSFRNPMQKHLADEVTTFLDLKDENEDALMKVHYKGRDHAIAEMDKYRYDGSFSFYFGNNADPGIGSLPFSLLAMTRPSRLMAKHLISRLRFSFHT